MPFQRTWVEKLDMTNRTGRFHNAPPNLNKLRMIVPNKHHSTTSNKISLIEITLKKLHPWGENFMNRYHMLFQVITTGKLVSGYNY